MIALLTLHLAEVWQLQLKNEQHEVYAEYEHTIPYIVLALYVERTRPAR